MYIISPLQLGARHLFIHALIHWQINLWSWEGVERKHFLRCYCTLDVEV